MLDCPVSSHQSQFWSVRNAARSAVDHCEAGLLEVLVRWSAMTLWLRSCGHRLGAVADDIRRLQRGIDHFVPGPHVIPFGWRDPDSSGAICRKTNARASRVAEPAEPVSRAAGPHTMARRSKAATRSRRSDPVPAA